MKLRISLNPKNRAGVSVVAFACLLALGGTHSAAWSQTQPPAPPLPTTVKSGHPRLLLTQDRIRSVQDVTVSPLLSPAAMPAHGMLRFDFTPKFDQPKPGVDYRGWIFDVYSSNRNSLFVRHSGDNVAAGTVRIQIAFQANGIYAAHHALDLPVNVSSGIDIRWDSTARKAWIRLNQGPTTELNLAAAANWNGSHQQFVWGARPGELIENVYLKDFSTMTPVFQRQKIDLKLQNAVQELLSTDFSLQWNTNALLNCTNADNPLSCSDPFNLISTHPNDVEGLARSLALAYRLADQADSPGTYNNHLAAARQRYLQAARNYAAKLLNVTPLAGDEYSMRGRVAAFSILYDWMFTEMQAAPATVTGFTSLADQMAQRVVDHVVAQKPSTGYAPYELGSHVCSGHHSVTISANPLKCNIEPALDGDPNVRPSVAAAFLGSHSRGNAAAIAQAMLAMHDERTEQFSPMLQTLYWQFANGYNAAREWVSVDGGFHMGYSSYTLGYNDPLASERLWQSALNPVSSGPVMDAPWQYKSWEPLAYALRGDRSHPALSDGIIGAFDPRVMSNLVLKAAVEGQNGYARWFYDQEIEPFMEVGRFSWSPTRHGLPLKYLWNYLYFGDITTPAQDLSDLPLGKQFRNAGLVVMRDTWDFDNATLLDFKSTSFASSGHHHLDQNSFRLFYRAPLLLDTGFYGQFGSPHWANYYSRTIAHNSLVVFDEQEPSLANTDTATQAARPWLSKDGGQRHPSGVGQYPTLEQAQTGAASLHGLEAFAHGDDFSYTRGNASRAYDNTKLDSNQGFVRHMAMLRMPSLWNKPVVVMFDRVKLAAGKEHLSPAVLFHTAQEPGVLGRDLIQGGVQSITFGSNERCLFDVTNGEGRVFIETLAPVNATAEKIGGVTSTRDYRFAVPTRLANGTTELTAFTPNWQRDSVIGWSESQLPELLTQGDVGAWRIEVKAPPVSTDGNREFIHVMSVADVGDAAMETPPNATRLSASPHSAAVLLQRDQAAGSIVVMILNSSGGVSDVFWDLPVAVPSQNYLVLGVMQGERFRQVETNLGNGMQRITLVRDSNGSLEATAEGALRVMN